MTTRKNPATHRRPTTRQSSHNPCSNNTLPHRGHRTTPNQRTHHLTSSIPPLTKATQRSSTQNQPQRVASVCSRATFPRSEPALDVIEGRGQACVLAESCRATTRKKSFRGWRRLPKACTMGPQFKQHHTGQKRKQYPRYPKEYEKPNVPIYSNNNRPTRAKNKPGVVRLLQDVPARSVLHRVLPFETS